MLSVRKKGYNMKRTLYRTIISTARLIGLVTSLVGCIPCTPPTPPLQRPGHEQPNQVALLQQLQKSGAHVIRRGEEIRLLIPKTRLFAVGLLAPTPEGRALLTTVAQLIQSYKDAQIGIIAHTDDIGSYREKMKNTTRQARNVAAYLWSQGVSSEQMHRVGWGDRYPITHDLEPVGRAVNRRVEIRIR